MNILYLLTRLTTFLISFVYLSVLTASPLPITKIHSISEANRILDKITKNTLVVFDVDHTLLTSTDQKFLITQNNEKSLNSIFHELFEGCSTHFDKSREHPIDYFIHAKRTLVEPKLKSFIDQIQSQGASVIAMTYLRPGPCKDLASFEEWRDQQLRELGFNFNDYFNLKRTVFSKFPIKNGVYPTFYNGILFTNDQAKGPVLLEFLKYVESQLNWIPDKIYFFDDKEHHTKSVAEILPMNGYQIECFFYTKNEDWIRHIDTKESDIQVSTLLKTGKWPGPTKKRPVLTASGIVHHCPTNKFILIERAHYPYGLAMFGGHIEYESPEAGFRREAQEELNISDIQNLQLIGVYGMPGRDPRKHVVDLVYSCTTNQKPKSGSDAKSIRLFTKQELHDALRKEEFAFDHAQIIQDYLKILGDCNPCTEKCKFYPVHID